MFPTEEPRWQREALKGAIPSAVMSAAMAFLVFGGRQAIPITGWDGIAFDAIPQSGMIAFMTFFMADVAVRRCHRLPRRWLVPATMSGIMAALAAAVAFALWSSLKLLSPPYWNLSSLVLVKAIYGIVLAIVLTPVALRLSKKFILRSSSC